jgi:hypothetical protein
MAVYRKDAIVRAGGWDESVPRSQDNDLHDRMNRIGARSYLAADASAVYLCRETYLGLLKQAWKNGFWNVMLMRMGTRCFRPRHFVPMAFVGWLFLLAIGSLVSSYLFLLLLGSLALYAVAAVAASVFEGIRRGLTWQIPLIPFWFLSLHLCYGFASWVALVSRTPGHR